MSDGTIEEGRTATSKDGKKRVVFKGGMWVNDPTFVPQVATGPGKTTPQDMAALNAANAKAQAERDTQRTYGEVQKSVHDFGTGPVWSRFVDAITPDDDGGILDGIGAIIGSPARAMLSNKTLAARDHLKTVNANVALAGSQQMKGSSSDKDTALMRLSGIGPSKTVAENDRIVRQARYNSGLEQTRALVTSNWISKFGSLAHPAPNGMTFEQNLQLAERVYDQKMKGGGNALPKAPPRRSGGTVTIDINGNPVR